MDYDEMKALEQYVKNAEAARDAFNRERAEEERLANERREHERIERLAVVEAHLREIVPPALWPLAYLDEQWDMRPDKIWCLPFLDDGNEIMRFAFCLATSMLIDPREIDVPDARLYEGRDEDGLPVWYADMVYNPNGLYAETTQGGRYGANQWLIATARAFEVYRAYTRYAQQAAIRNADLAERAKENEIVAQVFDQGEAEAQAEAKAEAETPEPDAYILLELSDLRKFEREVNQHLEAGYMLQGSPFVVMHDDPEFSGCRVPVYYQALVWPEPF